MKTKNIQCAKKRTVSVQFYSLCFRIKQCNSKNESTYCLLQFVGWYPWLFYFLKSFFLVDSTDIKNTQFRITVIYNLNSGELIFLSIIDIYIDIFSFDHTGRYRYFSFWFPVVILMEFMTEKLVTVWPFTQMRLRSIKVQSSLVSA